MTALPLVALVALFPSPSTSLPRSGPEAQGVRSARLLEFVQAAAKLDSLHSVMVVRHGHVIAEGWWTPYRADTRHQLYSLSKSFTSTAVGIAAAEGKLSPDDPVLKFFPEAVAPASPSANLKAMRLTDLLRMSTGHQTEPGRKPDESWAKTFLAHPVPFKPGTHFLYNTSATYMLSAAVQQATGQTLLDYLKPRLFDPLGIENPTWEASPQGVSTGGYGLSVRTEDIAKFGQLYLQNGKWDGKQLVPEAWVAAATARQTSNGSSPTSDWDQGYGYQFWRCRNGAYRGDGAFGQYCVVLPEQDAVIAMTSGVRDLQAVLNVVWDKLLPAFGPAPLPADAATAADLSRTLNALALRVPTGSGSPPAGVVGKTYKFPANDRKLESVGIEHGSNGVMTLAVRTAGADQRIPCSQGTWVQTRAGWGRLPEQPAAATGAWTSDDTYTARVCFVETPFVLTLKLTFAGAEVTATTEMNVGFGATKEAPLVGKAD